MRERPSHRNAPVCALLVFSAGFLTSICEVKGAFADESVTTLSTPPPPHHFGDRGDVVIPMLGASLGSLESPSYSAAGFSFTHLSLFSPGSDFRQTFTTFSFNPSADVFIGKHVSIGGDLRVSYQIDDYADQAPTDRQLSVGLSPRVGYAFPVSDHVTIWPRISLGTVQRRLRLVTIRRNSRRFAIAQGAVFAPVSPVDFFFDFFFGGGVGAASSDEAAG